MNESKATMENTRIKDELSFAVGLTDQVRKTVEEAESFKLECSELGKQVDRLSHLMRSTVRLATSSLYDRPFLRVISQVCENLERALTLARKCKNRNIFTRVVNITSVADFRRLFASLDSSIADFCWLLSIFDSYDDTSGDGEIVVTLPPIACNDPILSWVWSFIASIQTGRSFSVRIRAATELASHAKDNRRNRKVILEEEGVPPLLKLLKEKSSPDAQFAALTALYHLANEPECVSAILNELGVPLIVQVLSNSPMKVQIVVSNLVARMAENSPLAQEDFTRENAIRPLVSMLSFEISLDENHGNHSIAQINKILVSNSIHPEGSSSRSRQYRKERRGEDDDVKFHLKTSCAEALWKLAKGSLLNSKMITETKGLFCLAKIIEKESGELQMNCLMAVMEITAAAESNTELRRAAFRTNSPAANAIVDQLLRVINQTDDTSLQIPALKSIGSLARTFTAKEARVIPPLVTKLGHSNLDVAMEALVSLSKFADPGNFLCVEHSKAIIEFNGVSDLLLLLRGNERMQLNGLVLLCYLALHDGNNEALEHARVLTILEGADRALLHHHPELRELVCNAARRLSLYHSGVHSPLYII